jgi:outer membrane receptor protein involved in Fe transport
VVYFDVNVLNIHAEAGYEHNSKLNIGVKADYQKFNNDNDDIFWYKPTMKITLTGGYNIGDKILLKTDWFYNSSVYAKSDDSSGYTTLKGWFDLNLGGEYIYRKNLSLFVKLNNLASVRYNQWYNYPSYRLNLMGGLSYSF